MLEMLRLKMSLYNCIVVQIVWSYQNHDCNINQFYNLFFECVIQFCSLQKTGYRTMAIALVTEIPDVFFLSHHLVGDIFGIDLYFYLYIYIFIFYKIRSLCSVCMTVNLMKKFQTKFSPASNLSKNILSFVMKKIM